MNIKFTDVCCPTELTALYTVGGRCLVAKILYRVANEATSRLTKYVTGCMVRGPVCGRNSRSTLLFTSCRQWSLAWVQRMLSAFQHPVALWSILISPSLLYLAVSSGPIFMTDMYTFVISPVRAPNRDHLILGLYITTNIFEEHTCSLCSFFLCRWELLFRLLRNEWW
jgi:hypothetical protein